MTLRSAESDAGAKHMIKTIRNKLQTNKGESLAETLVALLVAALGITLLAGGVAASVRVISTGRDSIARYYSDNNDLTTFTDSSGITTVNGNILFKSPDGTSSKKFIDGASNKVSVRYYEHDDVIAYRR